MNERKIAFPLLPRRPVGLFRGGEVEVSTFLFRPFLKWGQNWLLLFA